MAAGAAPGSPRLPGAIWALGFVSLLMDVSSEMIHSLLPVFMVTTLGSSMLAVGLVEGAAEATALITKVFSGVISDWLGKRKPLAVLGYGLGAASKPLFALATSSGLVLGARLVDRIGKGIRGAPRDALVAQLAPPSMRGAAFGLRQSLDTVGAFLGPLLAIGLMLLWANDFRAVFWVAVIPGVLSVLVLVAGVSEPPSPAGERRTNPISPRWTGFGTRPRWPKGRTVRPPSRHPGTASATAVPFRARSGLSGPADPRRPFHGGSPRPLRTASAGPDRLRPGVQD